MNHRSNLLNLFTNVLLILPEHPEHPKKPYELSTTELLDALEKTFDKLSPEGIPSCIATFMCEEGARIRYQKGVE